MAHDRSGGKNSILFLFDIDGTLLDLFDYHLESYCEAFLELFNVSTVEPSQLTPFFGLPLRSVLKAVFRTLAIPLTEKNIEKAATGYLRRLRTKISSIGPEIIFPGVFDLLKLLVKESVPRAIITGNPRSTGEIIVTRTGLGSYFPPATRFYAHASRQETREELIYRGVSYFALLFQGEATRVVVTGDTVHDIAAALRTGSWPAAVSYRNRYYTEADLGKAGAEFLIRKPGDFLDLLPAAVRHFSTRTSKKSD